jgi:hypothetical protein
MALQEKLAAIREMAKAQIPPEARAIMERSTAELRASGIMDRIARVGQLASPFALPNGDGRLISLADLTARGPVVLSYYRGRW